MSRPLPTPRTPASRRRHSFRPRPDALEVRQLLSHADFELSSLLPANGGDGSSGFVVDGIVDGGQLGSPQDPGAPIGDVNQDGIDDLLLISNGRYSADGIGHAYVIFGTTEGFSASVDLHSLAIGTGYVITGIDVGDSFGRDYAGAVGDVNGDGISDIAIGASLGTPSADRTRAGRIYVLYGGQAHLTGLDLADGSLDGGISLAALDGQHGFTINGIAASDNTDTVRGAGDVNADGVDDLVIGSGPSANGAGTAYVVYGRDLDLGQVFPAQFELSSLDGANGFVIPNPTTTNDFLGTSVAGAGDLNGDGIADFMIGASQADPSGIGNAGKAYVIFGRSSFPATFDLTSLNGVNGFTVHGQAIMTFLGMVLDDVGDVNGDGFDDILIGAASDVASGNDGACYVIFGKVTATAGPFPSVIQLASLNGSNGFALVRSGWTFEGGAGAGDVNGDGYADIIGGNVWADPNGLTDAGQSYIVYGGPSFGSKLDAQSVLAANGGDGSAGYGLNGFLPSSNGARVQRIGDINNDGIDDVRISAISADTNGMTNNGQVYIVYGKPSPARPTKFYVVNDGAADRTYEYAASSVVMEDYALHTGNTAPRGAASTAAGDKVWVIDANKNVYVYNSSGGLLGSWTAGSLASNATVEGIATNGTDVWIVDARQDRVYRYTNAASRLSGSQNAASSFALNIGNTSPKDVVTDGTSLWVVNDSSTDKVFKYTLTGSLAGSWTISGAGSSPTGITHDPSGGGTLWTVDSGTDRIYQFDNARSRASGSQAPSTSFALAAGNTNPQGIADPPVGPGRTPGDTLTTSEANGRGLRLRGSSRLREAFSAAPRHEDRTLPIGMWDESMLTDVALQVIATRVKRPRAAAAR